MQFSLQTWKKKLLSSRWEARPRDDMPSMLGEDPLQNLWSARYQLITIIHTFVSCISLSISVRLFLPGLSP